MKRALALAIVVGAASVFSLTGCSDESSVTKKEQVSGPTGTTTRTDTTKVDSKGSNPPTDSAGETGKTGVVK